MIYCYVRKNDLQNPRRLNDDSTTSNSDVTPKCEVIKEVPMEDLHRNHTREVATHGFLYVGTFFFSYWSPLVLRVLVHLIEGLDDAKIFSLLLIQSICWPPPGILQHESTKSFFHQQPREYYSACAQSIMFASGRS